MIIGPNTVQRIFAQRQRLSRLGNVPLWAEKCNGKESSTLRTIKLRARIKCINKKISKKSKNLKVIEQNSLEIKNSNEKGRGLYSNVDKKARDNRCMEEYY